jgi:hypothetical protein
VELDPKGKVRFFLASLSSILSSWVWCKTPSKTGASVVLITQEFHLEFLDGQLQHIDGKIAVMIWGIMACLGENRF